MEKFQLKFQAQSDPMESSGVKLHFRVSPASRQRNMAFILLLAKTRGSGDNGCEVKAPRYTSTNSCRLGDSSAQGSPLKVAGRSL